MAAPVAPRDASKTFGGGLGRGLAISRHTKKTIEVAQSKPEAGIATLAQLCEDILLGLYPTSSHARHQDDVSKASPNSFKLLL